MAKSKMKIRMKNNPSKSKRWKKGSSCISNPVTSNFRSRAKSKFFQINIGSSYLTQDILRQHTDAHATDTEDIVLSTDDATSIKAPTATSDAGSVNTFATWATNYTACTNQTFARVQRYFNTNSELHKEVLGVLAAVTEIIQNEGGTESNTEYFAILVTALKSAESPESTSAILYLLNIVTQRTPTAVLQAKFSEVSKFLVSLLGKYTEEQSPTLLKSCLMCMGGLLKVQDAFTWSLSSTTHIYSSILTFITHVKPKIRKTAQYAIKVVLNHNTFSTCNGERAPHPAATVTAKFCIDTIHEHAASKNYTPVLHVLNLLQDLLCHMPFHHLKSSCEVILQLMTLNDPFLNSCCMKALNNLFSSSPLPEWMPADLNAKLITALYDYQPSVIDAQPTKAWFTVMESAHLNLSRLDRDLCLSHLAKVTEKCVEALLSEANRVRAHAAKTLKTLLTDCLATCISDMSADQLIDNKPILSLHHTLETTLGYQYHAAWPLILPVFTLYFQTTGNRLSIYMTKILQSLADFRESKGFPHKRLVDVTVGAAVTVFGPQLVLNATPLNITGSNDDLTFPRSWLLPVLRDHIHHTELSFFTTQLLSLAVKFKTTAREYETNGDMTKSRVYDTLQAQIWSTLPAFCKKPTDLPHAFPTLAKVLGIAISDRPDLRLFIMSALRNLVVFSLDNEESRLILAKYSKNYLPILFDRFTDVNNEHKDPCHLAYLQTARVYFKITPPQIMQSFCEKCLGQIKDKTTKDVKRIALLDITMAMVPYIKAHYLTQLGDYALSNLTTDNRTMQKKCYRVVEEFFNADTEASKTYISANLKTIKKTLIKSFGTAQPSSKASLLRTVAHLFKLQQTKSQKLLETALPQAILSTKQVGEQTHKAAYRLLLEIVGYYHRLMNESKTDIIDDFMGQLMAGLSGDADMIAATIASLTWLLYKYKVVITSKLRNSLLFAMLTLLKSHERQILKEVFLFVKIYIQVHEDMEISPNLEAMINGLLGMDVDTHHHFRFTIKSLFTKLVKKFGFDLIQPLTPPSYSKVMTNIRKDIQRKQKGLAVDSVDGDESDEDKEGVPKNKPETIEEFLHESDVEEEVTDDRRTKQTRGSGPRTWLRETSSIIDFLDSEATKSITSTRPEFKTPGASKTTEPEFKLSSDGRMIVTEPVNDNNTGAAIDNEDDLDDLFATIEMGTKSRKRKAPFKDPESDAVSVTSTTYKPGGRGIHRAMKKKVKVQKVEGETSGKEFKAKRAGGDIKGGKHDPYAYIPLKFSDLNRRKQAKLSGKFTKFVKGARRGAKSGKKVKAKPRK